MEQYSYQEGRTLQTLLDGLAEGGEREALVRLEREGADRLSFRQLADGVDRLAAWLAGRVGQGDTVLLFAEPSPRWAVACLAIIRRGAVVVPLDVQMAGRALASVVGNAAPRLAFTTSDKAEKLRPLGFGESETVLLEAPGDDPWPSLDAGEGNREHPRPGRDDPAVLFYTSGTTGPPKGVPLTHNNLAFQMWAVGTADVVRPGDRVLLPLPLHHVYPFVLGLLAPLHLHLTTVIPQSLTGPQLARAMREERVTVVIGVPRLYEALVSGIEARFERKSRVAAVLFRGMLGASVWARKRGVNVGRRLFAPLHRQLGPSVRVMACGGAALPERLAWRLEGLGWRVLEGYGLTETSPLLTLNRPGEVRLGSVGRAVPGVELRLENGTERGEILARGPGVFRGYREMPEATAEALTEEGWFRTGDLGRFDNERFLYVLGRASTLIVTESGENIQPEQVEEAYAADPIIGEAGVFARQGRLMAVLIPDAAELRRRGIDDPEAAVRGAVQERGRELPSYMRLADYVVSRRALARTRLGKIRRHLLAERFDEERKGGGKKAEGPMAPEEMADDDQALLDEPGARATWDWLVERYPRKGLSPDTSLALDLGIDSMEWLNLTVDISERTGVELGDEAIGRVETVRDLLREVTEASAGGVSVARAMQNPMEALDERQRRWLRPFNRLERLGAVGLYYLNRFAMYALFDVERGPIPEHDRPVVFAPLHGSLLDPFAIAAVLPRNRLMDTFWGGWTGIAFNNALVRAGSRLAHVVPVDPRSGPVASLALAAAVLKNGQSLVWFPEGQRTRDGRMQPFRPGLGLVLHHQDVPVLPVIVAGGYDAWPVHRRLPRMRPLKVVFGQPLRPADLEREGEGDDPARRIVDALQRRTADLMEETGPRPHQGSSSPS